jgi:hypothetical protein
VVVVGVMAVVVKDQNVLCGGGLRPSSPSSTAAFSVPPPSFATVSSAVFSWGVARRFLPPFVSCLWVQVCREWTEHHLCTYSRITYPVIEGKWGRGGRGGAGGQTSTYIYRQVRF